MSRIRLRESRGVAPCSSFLFLNEPSSAVTGTTNLPQPSPAALASSPWPIQKRFAKFGIGVCIAFTALAGLAILGGCAGVPTISPTTVEDNPMALPGISGMVHGGQQPITGATVKLYVAGSTGYGSAATYTTGNDLLGNNTVTTNSSGGFNITGDYTCPSSSSLVYIVASGGNPGLTGTVNNTASTLVAALGPVETSTVARSSTSTNLPPPPQLSRSASFSLLPTALAARIPSARPPRTSSGSRMLLPQRETWSTSPPASPRPRPCLLPTPIQTIFCRATISKNLTLSATYLPPASTRPALRPADAAPCSPL